MEHGHSSGIWLLLISLLLLYSPRQIWEVTETWKNSETLAPSKNYNIVLRCVGTVFIITGFVLLIKNWIY